MLDRAKRIVAGENDNGLQLTLPKESGFTTHPAILDMAYRIWARRNFEGVPPQADEVLNVNLDYLSEVLTYGEIVQFVRDEHKQK